MKKTLKALISDPILKEGGLIFVSSILVNFFNLIFWLYMVRKLSTQDYGELNSLVSVLMFFSVPVSILQTVITRYTSKYMAHQKRDEVKSLLFSVIKIVVIFLSVLLVVLIVFAHMVSGFLRIDEKSLVYIVATGVTLSSFTTVTLGVLFGLQKFNEVAWNNVVSGIAKLVTGFSLVAAGLKVFGALIGFVFSFVVTLGLSVFQLPSWLKTLMKTPGRVALDHKEIYAYFLPVSLSVTCFFALTNMDIILVKHFFSPLDAGYYSVAQMVGKIVLLVPSAIGVVMFPKVIDSHARNEDTFLILKKCLAAVGLLCGLATLGTFLFPEFILKALTRHTNPEAISLVKLFALSMTFFALVNIFMLYHVSLHRMGFVYALTLGALFQFLLIWFFHRSLTGILLVLLVFSTLLFILGIYFSRRQSSVETWRANPQSAF